MKGIRFIHTSDFHLGALFRNFIGNNVQEARREDFYRNVKDVFDSAIRNKAHLIIISGDIFHRSDPANIDLVYVSEQIGRVANHGIRVITIAGNHDKPKIAGAVNPLMALMKANAPNFYFYQNAPDKPLIINLDDKKIALYPLPYIDPRVTRGLNISYGVLIRRLINKMLDASPGDVDYKILIGHLTLSGARIKDIHGVYLNEPSISLDDIRYHEFDYVALGHVHTMQRIKDNVYYAGAIERIDFSERDEEKGYLYVELSEELHVSKQVLKCRDMVETGRISIIHKNAPKDYLIDALSSINIKPGALLKIRLEVDESSWRVLEKYAEELREYLLNNLGVLGYIIHKSYADESGSTIHEMLNVKPLRSVILDYIDSLDIDPKLKKRVKELAISLIDEVGLP